jgi:hypothetical protein
MNPKRTNAPKPRRFGVSFEQPKINESLKFKLNIALIGVITIAILLTSFGR